MRGMTSADGKMTGNVQQVSSYDKHKGQKSKATGGDSGGVHGPDGHDEIKQVVAEHGPAHTHIIKKNAHGHTSETHHADGHIHHADHASLEEAHEHGMHAMDEDGDHAEMGEDAEDRAGERDEMEQLPRTKAPSYMD
jgi:hypothetical protein